MADLMAVDAKRSWPAPTAAERSLLSEYRCTMCHKHCETPCRFTASDFRQLVEATRYCPDHEPEPIDPTAPRPPAG